jgi:hypothetical protein
MRKFSFAVILLALLASVSQATVYAPTTLEKLVHSSTIIVTARVVADEARWDSDHKLIDTFTTIEIIAVHKGNDVPDELVLRTPGGRIGDVGQEVATRPEFTIGEETVLFLVWHRGNWWVQSLGMGKFELETESGKMVAVNRRIGTDLLLTGMQKRADLPYPQFDAAEFTAAIKTVADGEVN